MGLVVVRGAGVVSGVRVDWVWLTLGDPGVIVVSPWALHGFGLGVLGAHPASM